MAGGLLVLTPDRVESLLSLVCRDTLQVEVPGHPESVNQIWRSGNGRVYKTRQANAWDAIAQLLIRKAAKKLYGQFSLDALKGHPIRIDLDFYKDSWHCKTKGKRHLIVRPDISNLIKQAEDALTRALGLDDSAVVELVVRKVEIPGSARTVIRLQFFKEYKSDYQI